MLLDQQILDFDVCLLSLQEKYGVMIMVMALKQIQIYLSSFDEYLLLQILQIECLFSPEISVT